MEERSSNAGEELRVFISYSRRDAAIADVLADTLATKGFSVTIDRRNLEFGERWQGELADFIRLSDTVIWLVSEASIRSEWVNWELDEVGKRNKRLVPVLIGDTPRELLPRQIGEIHILPVEGCFDLSLHLDDLVRVLHTNRGWIKEGSRLSDRAIEWLSSDRTNALLLRGGALAAAQRWKDRQPAKAPRPSQEVLTLILESQTAAVRRQRFWIGGAVAVALIALLLAGTAWTQRQHAEANARRAEEQRDAALINQSRYLTAQAQEDFVKAPSKALAVALEAAREPAGMEPRSRPLLKETLNIVDASWRADHLIAQLRPPHNKTPRVLVNHHRERPVLDPSLPKNRDVAAENAGVSALASTNKGNTIVAGHWDSQLVFYDVAKKEKQAFFAHEGSITAISSDQSKGIVAVAASDGRISIWDACKRRSKNPSLKRPIRSVAPE